MKAFWLILCLFSGFSFSAYPEQPRHNANAGVENTEHKAKTPKLVPIDLDLSCVGTSKLTDLEKVLLADIQAGRPVDFSKLTEAWIDKYRRDLKAGSDGINLPQKQILDLLSSLLPKEPNADPWKFREQIDDSLRQHHDGANQIYNEAKKNPLDLPLRNRFQCRSGSLCLSWFMREAYGADVYLAKNPVFIYTPGHVLQGFISKDSDQDFTLVGNEVTEKEIEPTPFGKTKDLASYPAPVRVIDANLLAVIDIFAPHLDPQNRNRLAQNAVRQTALRYGINLATEDRVKGVPSITSGSGSDIFSFGEPTAPKGDQPKCERVKSYARNWGALKVYPVDPQKHPEPFLDREQLLREQAMEKKLEPIQFPPEWKEKILRLAEKIKERGKQWAEEAKRNEAARKTRETKMTVKEPPKPLAVQDLLDPLTKADWIDEKAIEAAARDIVKRGGVAQLAPYLSDRKFEVRIAVAKALPEISAEHIKDFLPILQSRNLDEAYAGATALAKMGPAGVAELIKALRHGKNLERFAAAKAFGDLGPSFATEEVIDLLFKLTNDSDYRNTSKQALVKLAPVAFDSAVGVINQKNPALKGYDAAVAVLGESGDKAGPILLSLVKNDLLFYNQLDAAHALAKTGAKEKIAGAQEIIALLKSHKESRSDKSKIISVLGDFGPDAREAVALIAPELRSSNWDIDYFSVIAEALGRIGPAAKEALPDLRALLREGGAVEHQTRIGFGGNSAEIVKAAIAKIEQGPR